MNKYTCGGEKNTLNSTKSDLIIENSEFSMANRIKFSKASCDSLFGFDVIHAESCEAEYHTLIVGNIWQRNTDIRAKLSDALASTVSHYMKKHMIKKNARILFVGIGNPSVTSDSLGPAVCKHIAVSAGLSEKLPQVHAFPVGIPSKTGFESAALIRSLASLCSADIIVCADSLMAVTKERLQTVIQISDMGITPGSALSRTAEEVSAETAGVPVISIGVPMAIRDDALIGDTTDNPLIVTRAESDVICDCYATVIATGLNKAFFGNMRD